MALEQELELFSGNDAVLRLTVIDNITNLPLDLSGAQEIVWAMGKNVSGQPLITKLLTANDGSVTVVDAATGRVDITINSAEMEPLKGTFYHEVRLTNADNKKVTLVFGAVTIQDNLIRT